MYSTARTLFGIAGCLTVIMLIVIAFDAITRPTSNDIKKQEIKEYQSFKKDTEVINGTVQKAEKENHIILSDSYNLVVKSNGDSKLLKVDEKEYRNYQTGSKVHFRIDKTDNNSIVRDLKNKDDIDTLKRYKEYKKDNPKSLFERLAGDN